MDKLKELFRTVQKRYSKYQDKFSKQITSMVKKLKKSRRSRSKKGSKRQNLYHNLTNRRRTRRDKKARERADYLAKLPKSRWKRVLYRLHPKRVFHYWFSKRGALMALKISGIGFVVMVVLTLGLFAYYRGQLPDPKDLNNRLLEQTTKFFDRTGDHLLFEVYGDQNRTVVDFDQISDNLKNATVAIEDKDFYRHGGFSFSAIIRAALNNIRSGEATGQGGSTITQQFIKNSLLTDERTYTRKIKELILAIEMERLYSKDEILGFYLNQIPYGSLEYGAEAAARSFFDKPASELTIAEAAMMAALPQAPSYYSPYGDHTDELIERAHYIINLMQEQGYITQDEANEAKDVDILASVTPIEDRSLYDNIFAPHFVLEVQRQLEEKYSAQLVKTGGFKIITTLDYELQKIAEKAVKDNMSTVISPAYGGGGGDNAALVAGDVKTGQVLAMVGSRDFKYPKFGSYNAALANRQPGSSFKPFGYSELFKSDRWGPDSIIYDTPTSFGDYRPYNFDFGYRGKLLVRQALGESRNIPAVKALYIAGVQNVIELAKSMGNKSLGDADQYGLSLILGAGEVKLAEHTHAYGTFARGGKYVPQTYVLRVENADGEVREEWQESPGEQVLDPQIAWLMTNILTDDVARSVTFGPNNQNLVVPGLTHAVKTGSTDRSVDGWMMGYSAYIAAGVWVGNHDNAPMDTFTSWQTGPIFTQFMREAHSLPQYSQDVSPILERPAGIQTIKMDRDTGYAATDRSRNTVNGVFPSWYKKQLPDDTNKYTIDTVSGYLATDCTPERARQDKTASGLWPELLPDDPWFSLWARSAGYDKAGNKPTKSDDVHKCSDKLPEVSVKADKETDGIYTFRADVSKGTHDLKTLNFKVNGQIVSSQNIDSSGTYEYTHTFNSTGSKQITAEVIDEVLYDNQNSTTISVSSIHSGSDISIISPLDGGSTPEPVVFSWTSDSSADSYEICWREDGGATECDTSVSTTYEPTGGKKPKSGHSYSAWVKSILNTTTLETSPTISFSVI